MILINYLGVAGVLFATVITMVLINFVWGGKVLFDSYFEKSVFVYYRKIIFYAVITIITILVTNGICSLLPAEGLIAFIGKIGICCVVPNLCYLLLYSRTKEFKESIPFVLNLISKRKSK